MNAWLPHSSDTSACPSRDLRQRLAGRVGIVAPALRQRFGPEWVAAEIDLVLAHYVYGLVMEVAPDAGLEAQIGLLHDLAGVLLDPDALHCALRTAPPAENSPRPRAGELARAVTAAEAFGRRDARAVIAGMNGDPNQPIEPNSNIKPIRSAT